MNNRISDGLYIGVIQDLSYSYEDNWRLFAISIVVYTGEVDTKNNPLPYVAGVMINEKDKTNYEVGNYVLVNVKDEIIKEWKLFREGDIFQKW